jgi:hypothetical protein
MLAITIAAMNLFIDPPATLFILIPLTNTETRNPMRALFFADPIVLAGDVDGSLSQPGHPAAS